MDVSGVNANIAARFQPSSPAQRQKVSLEQLPDNYSFSGNACNEKMKKKNIMKALSCIGCSYNGTINNKTAYFQEINSKSGLSAINGPKEITGTIDDKSIVLTKTTNRSGLFGCTYNTNGTFDGMDFNLDFVRGNLLKESILKGTINGEEVEFKFPGSKVPNDEKTRDLLTSILMLNGCEANAKGGTFYNIHNSYWKNQEEAEQCLIAQEMGMI